VAEKSETWILQTVIFIGGYTCVKNSKWQSFDDRKYVIYIPVNWWILFIHPNVQHLLTHPSAHQRLSTKQLKVM